MKETLVYDIKYTEINPQDLPPIGYHFVCPNCYGYDIRMMVDSSNAKYSATCWDADIAFKIAERLNED